MAIVTISRGTLSGGEALANCLSERLGWPALSREVIREAASRYGIAENLLTEQMDKSPGLIRRRLLKGEDARLYLVAIQAALAERALEGNFVYHGHAGHLLLKELPSVLKVRLLAPMEYRIRMVMEKQGISESEAKNHIEVVDKGRIQWTKALYGLDWEDPHLYDMVVHLGTLSVDTACSVIDFTVRQPDFEETSNKQEILNQFALACRIKLRLAQNDRTRGMQIKVRVRDRVAQIYGKFLSSGPISTGLHRSEEDISEVIREFPEIEKVEFDVRDAGIPIET